MLCIRVKFCLSFFACPFGLAGFALLAVLWACLAGCGFALPDQALGFALLFCGGVCLSVALLHPENHAAKPFNGLLGHFSGSRLP